MYIQLSFAFEKGNSGWTFGCRYHTLRQLCSNFQPHGPDHEHRVSPWAGSHRQCWSVDLIQNGMCGGSVHRYDPMCQVRSWHTAQSHRRGHVIQFSGHPMGVEVGLYWLPQFRKLWQLMLLPLPPHQISGSVESSVGQMTAPWATHSTCGPEVGHHCLVISTKMIRRVAEWMLSAGGSPKFSAHQGPNILVLLSCTSLQKVR